MPPWKDNIDAMLMILPPPFGNHVARGGLRQEEHRLQVHVEHRIPVGLGEVDGVGAADDAGVVDQDVQPAELAHGFADDARVVGLGAEIGIHPDGAPAQRLDGGERFGGIAAADSATSAPARGERLGNGATEAGVGAGDRRDAARRDRTSDRMLLMSRSTFMGTQATSLYSWFSPPIAQMKL